MQKYFFCKNVKQLSDVTFWTESNFLCGLLLLILFQK